VSSPLPPSRLFDPASAADRRRFFIERALRTSSRGSGSNLNTLMTRAAEYETGNFNMDDGRKPDGER